MELSISRLCTSDGSIIVHFSNENALKTIKNTTNHFLYHHTPVKEKKKEETGSITCAVLWIDYISLSKTHYQNQALCFDFSSTTQILREEDLNFNQFLRHGLCENLVNKN